MNFVFYSVNMTYYINWFLDVEPILHSWSKSHLVLVYDLFYMFLNLVCYYFTENLYIHIYKRYWSVFYCCCLSLLLVSGYHYSPHRMSWEVFLLLCGEVCEDWWWFFFFNVWYNQIQSYIFSSFCLFRNLSISPKLTNLLVFFLLFL